MLPLTVAVAWVFLQRGPAVFQGKTGGGGGALPSRIPPLLSAPSTEPIQSLEILAPLHRQWEIEKSGPRKAKGMFVQDPPLPRGRAKCSASAITDKGVLDFDDFSRSLSELCPLPSKWARQRGAQLDKAIMITCTLRTSVPECVCWEEKNEYYVQSAELCELRAVLSAA